MSEYIVKSGDNLTKIASNLGLPNYKSLSGYNTANPNLITPGMVLTYGGAPAPTAAPASAPTPLADPAVLVAQQKADRQAMEAKQNAEQEGLFGQYGDAIKGQGTMTDAYNRFSTEGKLPEIQAQLDIFKNQIYGIKDVLDRLDESVTARTSGRVSAAQHQRIVAAESNPLQQNMSRFGTAMAPLVEQMTAGTNLVSTRLGLLSQDNATALKPLEMRINTINDKFAREITGFNQDNESALNVLLTKITRGQQLEDKEWDRVQALALQDKAHQDKLEEISAGKTGSGGGYDTSEIERILKERAAGGGGTTGTSSAPSRAGNSDNITYNINGKNYTANREDYAKHYTDIMGGDYNAVLAEVYKQFPDFKSTISGYRSPTSLFGMKG